MCVSAYTWLALWLSLLSTCSWCVVSAYTWLALWLSLSLLTCSWCVVSAYTWLALWLSLLSTYAGVWAHTLDWLYVSLSSPPVAGVWWAHTLDWLYDSLSSPPVAGVWWAHTLDWLYDSLSSPPVAGVWWAHTLDWLYDSLSSPPVSWCGVSAYTWLALCLSLLSTCSVVCGESIHLIGSMTLSSPPVAGVWWAHTLDWLYVSLSSPPVAGVWWEHTLDWLYDSLLSTCSWCVVSAYTWLALWLSPPLHMELVCGERIHLIGSMTPLSPLHL